jgi:hypothetical protein
MALPLCDHCDERKASGGKLLDRDVVSEPPNESRPLRTSPTTDAAANLTENRPDVRDIPAIGQTKNQFVASAYGAGNEPAFCTLKRRYGCSAPRISD